MAVDEKEMIRHLDTKILVKKPSPRELYEAECRLADNPGLVRLIIKAWSRMIQTSIDAKVSAKLGWLK